MAIETYADDNNGSYAGASATELSKVDPGLSSDDLEVVSTDSSYTITVASTSGTTFSIDGEQAAHRAHLRPAGRLRLQRERRLG